MKLRKKMITLGIISILSLSIIGCSNKVNDVVNIELNISVASSLREAIEELKEEYVKTNSDVDLIVNFGSSGSLKQQIEQGAPCDVFISAGKSQMDSLNKGGFLLSDTYKDLIENTLVLIAPKNSKISNINDLCNVDINHIGIGEPNSVPAGKYADEVLDNLSIKDKVKDKLVFAKDVKEVLAWTISENADAGFVYYTDAINSKDVKIIETIPKNTHSPITYPVAILKNSKKVSQAKEFEEFLLSDTAQEILIKYGYKNVQ